MNSSIKPSALIISGDITEGSEGKSKITKFGQFKSNWDIFWNVFDQINNSFPIFLTAGNHDEGSIESWNAKNHHYTETAGPENDFYVSAELLNLTQNEKIKIITLNPYKFPTAPLPFGLVVKASRETLDKLEAALEDKKNETKYTIVTSHFPIQCFLDSKSSKGRSMKEILSSGDSRIAAFIAGHFHMNNYFIAHINGSLEILGATTAFAVGMNVLSIDGGLVSYSVVKDDDNYPFIVTSPPQKEQFSPYGSYVNSSFRVRLVVFTNKSIPNITVTIDKKRIGVMDVDINDTARVVFGLNVSGLSKGSHTIAFSGPISKKFTFFVGNKLDAHKEKGVSFFIRYESMLIVSIILLTILASFLIIPLAMTGKFEESVKEFGAWLISINATRITCFGIMKAVLFGPLYIFWAFKKTPGRMHAILIIMFISSALLPFYSLKYDEDYVVVMMWGTITRTGVIFCVTQFILIIAMISGYFIPLIYLSAIAYGKYPDKSCFISLEMALLNAAPLVWIIAAAIIIYIGAGLRSVFLSPHVIMCMTFYFISTYLLWNGRRTEMQKSNQREKEHASHKSNKHQKLLTRTEPVTPADYSGESEVVSADDILEVQT